MARDRNPPADSGAADWERIQRSFSAGTPEFVSQLRQFTNAATLAAFAEKWYSDPRPEARHLLLDYLSLPLNAPRHEPLVKRLFKFAEGAGDDPAMAHVLAAFDRTVRRRRLFRDRWNSRLRKYERVEVVTVPPNSTLPRDGPIARKPSFVQDRHDAATGRFLFSVRTRQYLRRRAWRYFRKLGKHAPDRYVPAVCAVLKLYTDADIPNGLGMLDNWGLCHILFHHSPTLRSTPRGWSVARGAQLAQMQPDPKYRKLWLKDPEPIFDLLINCRCRAVSLWASKMLRRHFPDRLGRVETRELLRWLVAENAVLNDLALELLQSRGGLDSVPVDEWLRLTQAARPDTMDRICDLILRAVKPEQVPFTDAVRLAMQRPVPLARLGREFLTGKTPATFDEVRAIFGLREAEAEPVRRDLVRWAARVLGERPDFQPLWVLEFLDARHEDVREVGWEWLLTSPRARDDVTLWQRLLESPYDNIRLRLITMLEDRARGSQSGLSFSPDHVRYLWASVLLNTHRGGRAKPVVVRQIVDHLAAKPEEAGELLPILAVALRSVRGPEFRAGLSGVARFVDENPARLPLVEAVFPELVWN
jgi:hypothetical protein